MIIVAEQQRKFAVEMKFLNKVLLVFGIPLLPFINASAQQANGDSISPNDQLSEVVITATRSERKLSNVAVPVTIISQKKIQEAGSLRLKDILQEQTGLFLTSGFGTGVQLQGLNPDYTLILINGEPLVGRTAGILDLNRITIGNILKIEIVKGPSSSLYGSEALAGVINIITDQSYQKKAELGLRYGTYNTLDLNGQTAGKWGKLGINAFLNYFSTNGYSIRPNSVERTQLPIRRTTPQLQLSYPISSRTSFAVNVRYNREYIKNEIAVSNNGQTIYSRGRELNSDWNITPTLTHRFNTRLKTALRLYGTQFESSQQLKTSDNNNNYDDYFRQQFYRIENQTDYTISKKIFFVGGLGIVKEYVNSSRYDNKNNLKENNVQYSFTQLEFKPSEKLSIIGGLRYDRNQLYASAFSPKLALQYAPNKRFKVQASYGKGFKAPDFRQLYLNFTNTAAGGYSVYGAISAQQIIQQNVQAGIIDAANIMPDYYNLKQLRPEISDGYNIGFIIQPLQRVNWLLNFFRNDIKNLIESRLVVSSPQIYSYVNIKRAYTQGGETNIQWKLNRLWNISGGYQFLLTADKDELKILKQGNRYYTRDANGNSRLLQQSDYIGLPNRSKHMANLKLEYKNSSQTFFANTRILYRSKWVVFNADGNEVFNKQDEFANGFVQLNISAGKTLYKKIRLQAGIDNLLDYIDAKNLPNMPGRVWYASIHYAFIKNKNQ